MIKLIKGPINLDQYDWLPICWTIWAQYIKAITRNKKTDRRPLSFYRFGNHLYEYCDMLIDEKNSSFILGNINEDGIFFVSHWAPHSMRDGYNFLKQLLDMDLVVVFGCLENMSSMFSRLGFKDHGEFIVNYPYLQKKRFFSNITSDEVYRKLYKKFRYLID